MNETSENLRQIRYILRYSWNYRNRFSRLTLSYSTSSFTEITLIRRALEYESQLFIIREINLLVVPVLMLGECAFESIRNCCTVFNCTVLESIQFFLPSTLWLLLLLFMSLHMISQFRFGLLLDFDLGSEIFRVMLRLFIFDWLLFLFSSRL